MVPKRISHCLWFNNQVEEAVNHYTGIFKNSKIGRITRYSEEGFETHGHAAGQVMTMEFELEGVQYLALNGGPQFKFNEAISICVNCDTQEEVDYYWKRLSEGGEEGPCGWLKDKFGVSWQVNPNALSEMLLDSDSAKVKRVTKAFLSMKKFDIAELKKAFDGSSET